MKDVIAIVLFLVLCCPVGAEGEADSGKVLAQLDSKKPSEAAWAAYRAGKMGVTAAIPRLAEMLKPSPRKDNAEAEHLRMTVLDALVLLKAKVPGDLETDLVLHHAKRKCWRRCLVLLSRNPGENRKALLKLFGQPRGDNLGNATVAVGNLLCGVRAEGFTARILPLLPLRLEITVKDPGASSGNGGLRVLGGSGDGYIRLPKGFPPHADYLFWKTKRPGSSLLADGPRPIWFSRREVARSGLLTGVDSASHPSRDCTFEWLGNLLHAGPARFAFRRDHRKTVDYQSPGHFLEQAQKTREIAIAPWLELREQCLLEELLTPAEATHLELPLTVVITDQREDQGIALPPLPPLDRLFDEDEGE